MENKCACDDCPFKGECDNADEALERGVIMLSALFDLISEDDILRVTREIASA